MNVDHIDKIRRDIELLRKKSEEKKRERVAMGLLAEPPEDFLPLPISGVLADRIKSVCPFIAKYAKLVLESGQLLPVSVEKLEGAKEYADILRRSTGMFLGIVGMAVYGAIREIEQINESLENGQEYEKSAGKAAADLYLFLKLAGHCKHAFNSDIYDEIEDRSQLYVYYAEYKRLKSDDKLFEAELAKHQEHYTSIKHLY
jgi:hypothetical protein